MINKESFVAHLENLERLRKAEEKVNEILVAFGSENQLWSDAHESLIVDILQDVFNDKKNDWIGYALYELDWFTEYRSGMITGVDGKDIPLRNASDLYDLLVDNMKSGDK